jgi:hypothetical protein
MNSHYWNQAASEFAQELGRYRLCLERGAVSFRFLDEATLHLRSVLDCPLVIGIFGNDHDNYAGRDQLAEREVNQLRDRLKVEAVQELGFGISEDGGTWALLVRANADPYQTAAGREFHKELLRLSLERVVWEAWRTTMHAAGEQVAIQGGLLSGPA